MNTQNIIYGAGAVALVSLAFAVCGGFAVKSAIARLDLLRAAEDLSLETKA